MWQHARPEIFDWVFELTGESPEFDQLLGRALICRLITEIIRHAGTPHIEVAGQDGELPTELVLARLGG